MAAGPAPENAVFMLQADQIDIIDIQKVGGPTIGFDILLCEFEANATGILVPIGRVIDRQSDAGRLLLIGGDGLAQIGGKGRDSASARQIVADEGDSSKDRTG